MALTEGALVHMLRQEPVSLPIVYVINGREIFDGKFLFKKAIFSNYHRETTSLRAICKNGELVGAEGAVKPAGLLIQVVAYDFNVTYWSLHIESFNLLETTSHVLGCGMDNATELTSLTQCYTADIVARFPLYQPVPFEGQLNPCIYDMCWKSWHGTLEKSKFAATDRRFLQFLRVKKREFDSYSYVISDGQHYRISTLRATNPLLLKMFESKEIIEGTVICTNMKFEQHPIQGTKWMSVAVAQRIADIIGTPKNIRTELSRWWREEREVNQTQDAREPFSRAHWTVPSVLSAEYVDCLDRIQWGKYSSADGSAGYMAQNILDLASADNEESDQAVDQLLLSVLLQGSIVYSSTPLVVESVAALLAEPISEHARKNVWNTLHQITNSCAIQLQALSEKDKGDSKIDSRFPWEENDVAVQSKEDVLKAVLKALEPKLTAFVNMLQQESISNVDKMYLCSVLSSLIPSVNNSTVVSTVVSTVFGMVQSGKEDEVVTAALLGCLAVCASQDSVVRRVLEGYLNIDSYPLLCRIAVGLQMAKTLKTEAPASCLNLLDECISRRHIEVQQLLARDSPTFPSWLNQDVSWHIDFVEALAALGVRGVPVVTKNLKRLFKSYYNSNTMKRLKLVLRQCFRKTLGAPNPDLNHLTPIQRDLLKEIASLPVRMKSSKRNANRNPVVNIAMARNPFELPNTIARMLRNYGLPFLVADLTSLVSRLETWDRRRTAFLLRCSGGNHPFVNALCALPFNLFRTVVKFV